MRGGGSSGPMSPDPPQVQHLAVALPPTPSSGAPTLCPPTCHSTESTAGCQAFLLHSHSAIPVTSLIELALPKGGFPYVLTPQSKSIVFPDICRIGPMKRDSLQAQGGWDLGFGALWSL